MNRLHRGSMNVWFAVGTSVLLAVVGIVVAQSSQAPAAAAAPPPTPPAAPPPEASVVIIPTPLMQPAAPPPVQTPPTYIPNPAEAIRYLGTIAGRAPRPAAETQVTTSVCTSDLPPVARPVLGAYVFEPATDFRPPAPAELLGAVAIEDEAAAVQKQLAVLQQLPEPPAPPAEPARPLALPPVTAAPVAPVRAAPAAGVVQADCKSCGTPLPGPAIDLLTADPEDCVPGRYGSAADGEPSHAFGRFIHGIYNCVCLPDPCYEPKWTPLADTAFFTPTARPVTQARFRGNFTQALGTPDRAEYFWSKGVGSTRGPRPADGGRVARLDQDRLSVYNEAATGKFSFYTEYGYQRVRPDGAPGASGFTDLTLGTKTLLVDCEMLQVAFQMQTTIPTANTEKGLGTGHTTLEPSLIMGLKLSRNSYLQAQLAERIPIAGDPEYAGAALRYSFAYNHVLCRPVADCPLIGTLELQGLTFQDGLYTDPVTGVPTKASSSTYLGIGPGLRQFICDRADLGFGSQFGIGNTAGARREFRVELRVRY